MGLIQGAILIRGTKYYIQSSFILFFDLTHFRGKGTNASKNFVCFLRDLKPRKIASEINWTLSHEIKSEPVKREIRKNKKYYDIKERKKEERIKKKKGKIIRIFWTTEKVDYLSSICTFHSPIFSIYQSCFFTKLLLFKETKIHHSTCPKLYWTVHAIVLRIYENKIKMLAVINMFVKGWMCEFLKNMA